MKSILIFLTGLLLLAGLAFLCINFRGPQIQQDIAERSASVLQAEGLTGVHVDVDGRDVTLSGKLPDKGALESAVALIEGVEGVRTVNNEMVVARLEDKESASPGQGKIKKAVKLKTEQEVAIPEEEAPNEEAVAAGAVSSQSTPDSHFIEIDFKDGRIVLKGYADPSQHDRWLAQAEAIAGQDNVDDQLQLTDHALQSGNEPVSAALEALSQLEHGSVRISDRSVKLTGKAASSEIKQAVESILAQKAPEFESEIEIESPPPLSKSAIECQQRFASLLSEATIEFNSGQATIKPGSYPLLDRLADVAKKCPGARFEVAGHTDASGDPKFNSRLSQARAEAVRRYLQERGVLAERMVARGYGDTQPIADNSTATGRMKNRRVEIIIIGEEKP